MSNCAVQWPDGTPFSCIKPLPVNGNASQGLLCRLAPVFKAGDPVQFDLWKKGAIRIYLQTKQGEKI